MSEESNAMAQEFLQQLAQASADTAQAQNENPFAHSGDVVDDVLDDGTEASGQKNKQLELVARMIAERFANVRK